MQATVIYPGGGTDALGLPTDEILRMQTLKELVGGPLEVVPVPGARYMVFWEDAKLGPHCVNETATVIARETESILPDDYLAGVVVLVSKEALD